VAKNVADIVELLDSIADEHYVVDYPDMVSFRRMYSQYAKRRLENNEVVILLPYYETTDGVREVVLSEWDERKDARKPGFSAAADGLVQDDVPALAV
jgi:hypothetical protein